MKCSPDISNFLEKISSLSHSIAFLYFFFFFFCIFYLRSLCYLLAILWNSASSWLCLSLSFTSFPGGSDGKNLPSIKETWVQYLGWKDPLEKGTNTHFSVLAWRISWTEEPSRPRSMGLQRVGYN